MSPKISLSKEITTTYAGLRQQVTEILLQGQNKLERLKVKIYWQTGRLILDYIEAHFKDSSRGQSVIDRLAQDINVDRTLLYRIMRFAKNFSVATDSNVAVGQHLTWTHYRALLGIDKPKLRHELEHKAIKEKWTARILAEEIKLRKNDGKEKQTANSELLPESAFGNPEIFQVKTLCDCGRLERKVLDLGFYVYKKISQTTFARFKNGDRVIWDESQKKFNKVEKRKSPYYYIGRVEKVVDGDTLRVQIDLGFGEMTRQYLRLLGLNTPEIGTITGRKAKRFVQTFFEKETTLCFQSTKRDLHGRYLSHVWKNDLYLNNLLLKNRLAVRM